jgi:transporter family-2 protein
MTGDRRGLGIAAGALGGAAVTLQARLNGDLADSLGDGFVAALISFVIGLVLVVAGVLAMPVARHGVREFRDALRLGKLRARQCTGGVCGAIVVASQGLSVGTLGVAIFTIAIVGGQSVAGLAVDHAGLGPSGPEPLAGTRIAGALLTVVAVGVAVAGRITAPSALALAVLPVVAGAASAWQQAVNGRVRQATGSAATATLVNFVVGLACLAVVCAVDLAVRGRPAGSLPARWWEYLGGVISVLFVAVTAAVVRYTGVLLLSLAMIAGQLAGAVAIDSVVPGGTRPDAYTLAGVGLTMVAVAIAAVRPRSDRRQVEGAR